MDKLNFIITSNDTSATLLRNQGFTCLGQDENGIWRFLNDSKMTFDVDPKNIKYTNMLNI